MLGIVIAARRHKLGLKQEELAALIHRSQSYISQVETGVLVPPIRNLEKIAKVFGLTAADLLNLSAVPQDQATDAVESVPGGDAVKSVPAN